MEASQDFEISKNVKKIKTHRGQSLAGEQFNLNISAESGFLILNSKDYAISKTARKAFACLINVLGEEGFFTWGAKMSLLRGSEECT